MLSQLYQMAAPRSDLAPPCSNKQEPSDRASAASHCVQEMPETLQTRYEGKTGLNWTLIGAQVQVSQTRRRCSFRKEPQEEAMKPV